MAVTNPTLANAAMRIRASCSGSRDAKTAEAASITGEMIQMRPSARVVTNGQVSVSLTRLASSLEFFGGPVGAAAASVSTAVGLPTRISWWGSRAGWTG